MASFPSSSSTHRLNIFDDPFYDASDDPAKYPRTINSISAIANSSLIATDDFWDLWFELYNIEMRKLDPSRKSLPAKGIWSKNCYGREFLYRQCEDGKIPGNTPLSLVGPTRPYRAWSPIYVWFGECKWNWFFALHFENPSIPMAWISPTSRAPVDCSTPVSKTVVDEATDSSAIVRFELIHSPLRADLEFQFVDEENRPIQIIDGVISATTNGNPDTYRLVRRFGEDLPLALCDDGNPDTQQELNQRFGGYVPFYPTTEMNDNLLDPSKQKLSLYRSSFALPRGAMLFVSVVLTYLLHGTLVTERKINHALSLRAPDKMKRKPLVVEDFFPDLGGDQFPKLRLKVSWSDPIFDLD